MMAVIGRVMKRVLSSHRGQTAQCSDSETLEVRMPKNSMFHIILWIFGLFFVCRKITHFLSEFEGRCVLFSLRSLKSAVDLLQSDQSLLKTGPKFGSGSDLK